MEATQWAAGQLELEPRAGGEGQGRGALFLSPHPLHARLPLSHGQPVRPPVLPSPSAGHPSSPPSEAVLTPSLQPVPSTGPPPPFCAIAIVPSGLTQSSLSTQQQREARGPHFSAHGSSLLQTLAAPTQCNPRARVSPAQSALDAPAALGSGQRAGPGAPGAPLPVPEPQPRASLALQTPCRRALPRGGALAWPAWHPLCTSSLPRCLRVGHQRPEFGTGLSLWAPALAPPQRKASSLREQRPRCSLPPGPGTKEALCNPQMTE